MIEVLEEALGVPEGTLRLPLYLRRAWDRKVKSGDYSSKMRAAKLKPYFKRIGSVLEEIQGLTLHKTLDDSDDDEGGDYDWLWTVSEGGGVPTSDIAKSFICSFTGFCALPADSSDPYLKGMGVKEEDLSLALLADRKLWKEYIRFMRLRSGLRVRPADPAKLESLPAHMLSANKKWEFHEVGGKYNGGTLWFLRLVSSLLRPGSGYLYLHPEYAEKLGSRMVAATWQEQCVKTRDLVNKRYKKILKMKKRRDRNHYDYGRDPVGNIKRILEQKRPLVVLQGMVKAMLEDLLPEYAPTLERARPYRDVILVALLCANPLRVHMSSLCEAAVGVKRFFPWSLTLGTPTPRSEFLSPLCSRSFLGEYSDARRKCGFGGGRRYSIDGALRAKTIAALARLSSELTEMNVLSSAMTAMSPPARRSRLLAAAAMGRTPYRLSRPRT